MHHESTLPQPQPVSFSMVPCRSAVPAYPVLSRSHHCVTPSNSEDGQSARRQDYVIFLPATHFSSRCALTVLMRRHHPARIVALGAGRLQLPGRLEFGSDRYLVVQVLSGQTFGLKGLDISPGSSQGGQHAICSVTRGAQSGWHVDEVWKWG